MTKDHKRNEADGATTAMSSRTSQRTDSDERCAQHAVIAIAMRQSHSAVVNQDVDELRDIMF